MRRYLESYALNTAGIVDHHTIYTAAGVARKTGEAYEQLLRNLLVVDLLPAWWSNRVRRLRQEKGQHEVDLLVEYGAGRVFAFEVKTSSAPRREDARHLTWLRDELGDRFVGGAVLHTGPRAFMMDDRIVAAPLSSLWT
jgi:predicted AAA+ superfamily ATPase